MNSVFHPPEKNPFQLPPLPQAHYLPSPAKETPDKSISLTPQKLKHRHEYSLPPEVYTPEQYSICEENSLFKKPPLPSTPKKEDVAVDLRKYLDDVTSWTSSQFCEQWPSRDTQRSGISPQTSLNETEMRSREPMSSTQRSSQRPATVKMKTSFASDRNLLQIDTDRNSEIARRLNRFRYGDPKPPQERKKERSKLPLPSVSGKKTPVPLSPRTSSKQEHHTSKSLGFSKSSVKDPKTVRDLSARASHDITSSHRSDALVSNADVTRPKSNVKTMSPDPVDVTISTLDSRLEKLLQESTSVMSSPEPRVSSRESTVPASVATSGNFDSKVSSLGSDDFRTQLTLEKSAESRAPIGRTLQRKLPTCNVPPKTYWRDESPPRAPVRVSPHKTRQEDDILYQWRLRRKLETARDDVAKGKGNKYMDAYQKPQPLAAAECPVGKQQMQEQEYMRPTNIRGTFQAETVNDYAKFGRKVSCSCQGGAERPSSPRQAPMRPVQDEPRAPTPVDTTAPRTGCRMSYSPTRPKKSVGVGVTQMKSMETQTGRSLLLIEDAMPDYGKGVNGGSAHQSASDSSLPHTSTPASSVSFHRVKIVPAEPQNSPVTSKGSPQARVMSPLSTKTDATTIWSSTDQMKDAKSEGGIQTHRSPASSIKTNRQFASDSESFSPTTNVVSQVVGARLFNMTQTPGSASGVARLQRKKSERVPTEENDVSETLSSSYTSTLHQTEPQKIPQEADTASESSIKSDKGEAKASEEVRVLSAAEEDVQPPMQEVIPSSSRASPDSQEPAQPEFDPMEMFDKLLSEIENDPDDFADDPVLRTLRSQRDQFLADFRAIERDIEDSCADVPERDQS